MPQLTTDDGVRLHYIERGDADETVVFSHSFLADHTHFMPQIEALSERYRVVAYDHRGHGQSDKPHRGYSMERIYADGVAVAEKVGDAPVHWIGLSTGGFVGMRMGFRRPELLKSLVLMDTSAGGEPTVPRIKYSALFVVLDKFGMGPVKKSAMQAMFGPAFLSDPARQTQRREWEDRFSDNDFDAIIAFGKAIFAREDVRAEVRDIDLPTLVVVGEDDQATTPDKAVQLTAAIPGARMVVIPRAGHLCTVEEPEIVNEVLGSFLDRTRRSSAR